MPLGVQTLGGALPLGGVSGVVLVTADWFLPAESLGASSAGTLAWLEDLGGSARADAVTWVEFDGVVPGAGGVIRTTLFIRNLGRFMNRGGM